MGCAIQESLADKAGISMGPISLTFASLTEMEGITDEELDAMIAEEKKSYQSIHSMTTAEWRGKYEVDGLVDLWVEEEFNAGSRLVVRYVYLCTVWLPHVHTAFYINV